MDPRERPRAVPVWSVGAAAGAIRPSSGYAFSRIQRHVDRVARALVRGMAPPVRAGSARLAVMDRIFLAALQEQPDHGERLLWSLARRAPADAFARFMTDTSTPLDEGLILRALPPLPMGGSALRLLAGGMTGGRPEAPRPSSG